MVRFALASLLLSQLFLVYSTPAFAETDSNKAAWLMLEKAGQAARELTYKGIFTHQTAGHMRSVEITHMNAGQGEYSRVVMLDGTPMEVLKQGQNAVIFDPKSKKVVIEKRRGQIQFPALLPPNMNILKKLYTATLGGEERVGGHLGQVINLTPRDEYRYRYRLCVDKTIGLLLKAEIYNIKNQAVENIAFNRLDLFNTRNLDWFQPKVDQSKDYVMKPEAASPSTVGESEDWEIAKVPTGYRQVDYFKRAMPHKHDASKVVEVSQLIFSDGMSSVSLFIQDLVKGVRPKQGHTTVGSTSFYASVLDGHQIVVVGEVPEVTVTEFANAVSFNK